MDKLIKESKLAFDDIGTGSPALLLFPGWCADRGILAALMEVESKKRRVINIDLLGHNESWCPESDFSSEDIVCETIKLVDSLNIDEFVTVSVAHAGWIAIELRRRLVHRVSKMVFLEWIIIEPPEIFFETLAKMQKPEEWQSSRDALFAAWSLGDPNLVKPFLRFMANYDFDMWARAGREIGKSYREFGSALRSLETLAPSPTVLNIYSSTQIKNLYSQPDDTKYFEAQQVFANKYSWYHIYRSTAKSHLPSVEVTQEIANAIESFLSNTAS
ncbi:alpha/beta hydrolase [Komarekiella sp. 'clone 1']|uniref:Alpha/beta hydrolase n=1 Tax=Komarekiella delphini-convector SJRDD-AB1 TaxID=2593771 RepID=A0AA40T3W5_9NOST|nr:alpha/beta hydrolase [Komarekiella delphini-convector]MBD6620464.1 alpha/beta hydrolase [Komarekiella delphini-convector SJRDD-AB1]